MEVKLTAVTQPLVKTTCAHDKSSHRFMTMEEFIIYDARLSSTKRVNNETAPRLLRYLIDNKHWSPFEHVYLSFEIITSRAISQQLIRHRSFTFQEFSQRYAAIEQLEPIELRMKAKKNRQSSTTVCEAGEIKAMVFEVMTLLQQTYNSLLEHGIATECARMIMPMATQTTIVMTGSLRSWIHFFEQRCDGHAQKEIQKIAYEIRNQLTDVCPWTAKALHWAT